MVLVLFINTAIHLIPSTPQNFFQSSRTKLQHHLMPYPKNWFKKVFLPPDKVLSPNSAKKPTTSISLFMQKSRQKTCRKGHIPCSSVLYMNCNKCWNVFLFHKNIHPILYIIAQNIPVSNILHKYWLRPCNHSLAVKFFTNFVAGLVIPNVLVYNKNVILTH